jgi:hypothetical protein
MSPVAQDGDETSGSMRLSFYRSKKLDFWLWRREINWDEVIWTQNALESGEVTERWRKLCKEGLRNLNPTPIIRTRRVWRGARVGNNKCKQNFSFETREEIIWETRSWTASNWLSDRRTLVNAAMNLQVPQRNFLNSWISVTCSRNGLYHEFRQQHQHQMNCTSQWPALSKQCL